MEPIRVEPIRVEPFSLSTNIKLEWKWLKETKALAYRIVRLTTAVKSFIENAKYKL